MFEALIFVVVAVVLILTVLFWPKAPVKKQELPSVPPVQCCNHKRELVYNLPSTDSDVLNTVLGAVVVNELLSTPTVIPEPTYESTPVSEPVFESVPNPEPPQAEVYSSSDFSDLSTASSDSSYDSGSSDSSYDSGSSDSSYDSGSSCDSGSSDSGSCGD